MQTTELIAGNEIYKQLIEMINCNKNSIIQCQSQLAKIQVLCSEARKTWASAAFSDITEHALKRYFSYQLKSIISVLDLVDERQVEVNCITGIYCLMNREILLLLDHLVIYFKPYIDQDIDCPFAFKDRIVKDFFSKTEFIYNWTDNLVGFAKPLGVAVNSYLKHFELSGRNTVFSFGELLFFVRFVNTLEPVVQNLAGPDQAPLVADQLRKLEFNHYSLFDYFQSTIGQRLKGTNSKMRKNKIEDELRLLNYKCGQVTLRYDFRWPCLGDMLSDWLLQELKKLEKESLITVRADECRSTRMQVMLSVSQLAGLAKLFVKEKVFGDQAVNDVFAFFTNSFSSKRQEIFSQGNFIKEYYSISQVTAAELRDLLLRMVARINRDFFPVVAVVSLLSLYYQGT